MVTQPRPKKLARSWVLLSYRVPRNPSTPRIAVWRQLKELGVAQIGDGLVALPNRPPQKEQLEWVAAKVLEADGEAIIWIADPAARRDGASLEDQLGAARSAEYDTLLDEVGSQTDADHRTIARWRREWRRIDRRDYFPSDRRDAAKAAIDAIAQNRAHQNQPTQTGSTGSKPTKRARR